MKGMKIIVLATVFAFGASGAFAQSGTSRAAPSGGEKQGGESVTAPGSAGQGQNKEGQVQSK